MPLEMPVAEARSATLKPSDLRSCRTSLPMLASSECSAALAGAKEPVLSSSRAAAGRFLRLADNRTAAPRARLPVGFEATACLSVLLGTS